MSNELIEKVLQKLEVMDDNIQTMDKRIQNMDNKIQTMDNRIEIMDISNKQEFANFNDKISEVDNKIDTIYTQVANNMEHQTMVELELKQIKQQTSLDHKVAELETELKLIKKVITSQ